jgi:hypothetical protein
MSVKGMLEDLTPRKRMQFAPVEDDDDELSELIKADPLAQDDLWDLEAEAKTIDAGELDAFWTKVLRENGPLQVEQDDQA